MILYCLLACVTCFTGSAAHAGSLTENRLNVIEQTGKQTPIHQALMKGLAECDSTGQEVVVFYEKDGQSIATSGLGVILATLFRSLCEKVDGANAQAEEPKPVDMGTLSKGDDVKAFADKLSKAVPAGKEALLVIAPVKSGEELTGYSIQYVADM